MVKIYIASPYTNGDKQNNVYFQMDVAEQLMNRGYAPYVPTMLHYMEIRNHRTEEDWLNLDFEYLSCCDIVIRMKPLKDGVEIKSPGADKEEALARKYEIPVFIFNTIEQMCAYLDNHPFDLLD